MSEINSKVYLRGALPEFLLTWTQQVGITLRPEISQSAYYLQYKEDKLQLCWQGRERFSSVYVQTPSLQRRQASNLLIKALGKKTQSVVDLTAGFGLDAMTIAATGRQVHCIERCAAIALLLYDGIYRCPMSISDNLTLYFADSKDWLQKHTGPFDLLYMDTMFEKKKKTAKASKVMQICRQLVGDDTDAQQLYQLALKSLTRRVLVKRSDDALQIGRTVAQYKGKTVRFDLYDGALGIS